MIFTKKSYKKNKPHWFLFKSKIINNLNIFVSSSNKTRVLSASVLIFSGLTLLSIYVIYPIFAAQMELYNNKSTYSSVHTPVAKDDNLSSLQADFNGITFGELSNENLKANIINTTEIPEQFYLSIPKLDIYNAEVKTNSTTLDPKEYIGHYKQTCLPGEACNGLIYGHSTNTWVENNYKEGDYSAVFTRLRELDIGDTYSINYAGQTFNYKVDQKFTKLPEDINPLENPYDDSYNISSTTLFTCDPPGTTKYRLHVVGKKIN